MANVTGYSISFFGSAAGYQDMRAQIQLMDGATVLGWVRFHDAGQAFPDDSNANDKITMHLPSAMFSAVVDMLRNEKPIKVWWAAGKAFIGTEGTEMVGEGDKA
jgi:hypothetical protein